MQDSPRYQSKDKDQVVYYWTQTFGNNPWSKTFKVDCSGQTLRNYYNQIVEIVTTCNNKSDLHLLDCLHESAVDLTGDVKISPEKEEQSFNWRW